MFHQTEINPKKNGRHISWGNQKMKYLLTKSNLIVVVEQRVDGLLEPHQKLLLLWKLLDDHLQNLLGVHRDDVVLTVVHRRVVDDLNGKSKDVEDGVKTALPAAIKTLYQFFEEKLIYTQSSLML